MTEYDAQLGEYIDALRAYAVRVQSERDELQHLNGIQADNVRKIRSERSAAQAQVESLRADLFNPPPDVQEFVIRKLDLVSRAELAAERERVIEECAKVCEAVWRPGDWSDGVMVSSQCAAAIRALFTAATKGGEDYQ